MSGLPKVAIPCPDWCGLPAAHGWDADWPNGVQSRNHAGPVMGRHVSVYGTEYDVAPGLLTYGVCVSDSGDLNELDPQQARALAEQLLEAAAWVEANQET